MSWGNNVNEESLRELINRKIRQEKIAIKDVKLRTFITEDASRNEMVQHVYDITYGTVKKDNDTLVVIDDSDCSRHYIERKHHQNVVAFRAEKNHCGIIGSANSLPRLLWH